MQLFRFKWILFAALILFASSAVVQAQSVRRVDDGYLVDMETRIVVGQSLKELNISSYPGDVDITRTSSMEALFSESIYVKAENRSEAVSVALKLASSIEDQGSRIRIRGSRARERAHSIEIRIPSFMEVKVSAAYGDITLSGGEARARLTTGAGDILVEDLQSSVEISTGAGDIEAMTIAGTITARTGAGDVVLSDVGSDVAVITGAGDIELSDITGGARATTGGGQIEGRRLSGNITLLTAGGDIDLSFIEGDLELNTSGGEIELDEIIGNVHATTSGGDIEARNIEGNLIAETLAGDIDVVDIAGDVKIISKVGDIYVRLDTGSQIRADRIDIRAENGDIDLVLSRKINADIRVDLGVIGSLETQRFSGNLVWDTVRRAYRDERIRSATGRLNHGGIDIELFSGSGNISISDNDN